MSISTPSSKVLILIQLCPFSTSSFSFSFDLPLFSTEEEPRFVRVNSAIDAVALAGMGDTMSLELALDTALGRPSFARRVDAPPCILADETVGEGWVGRLNVVTCNFSFDDAEADAEADAEGGADVKPTLLIALGAVGIGFGIDKDGLLALALRAELFLESERSSSGIGGVRRGCSVRVEDEKGRDTKVDADVGRGVDINADASFAFPFPFKSTAIGVDVGIGILFTSLAFPFPFAIDFA
jgi:hypothetical protein